MMYCEKCKILFTSSHCPGCNGKIARSPELNDLCFLTEQQLPWSDMLKDVLEQNGIPVFTQNTLGAGMVIKAGSMLERIKFYVPFLNFEKAQEIVGELFSDAADSDT